MEVRRDPGPAPKVMPDYGDGWASAGSLTSRVELHMEGMDRPTFCIRAVRPNHQQLLRAYIKSHPEGSIRYRPTVEG